MEMIIKNLSKSYGDKVIYDNFNLEITPNEKLVILGESGVGKTTLLNVLLGLTDFEGEIQDKPNKVSVVFQENRLVPNLSVKDNLKLVASDVDIEDVLKQFNLQGQGDKLPKNLSAGMARRVALIRAIIYDAPLVLMDEPFINLDIALKFSLIQKLNAMFNEKPRTVVAIMHDIAEAVAFADRIVVISDGKVAFDTKVNKNTEKELFGIMMNIGSEKVEL